MATQNRTTLKTYFQTGDVPTQSQFGDLIDSTTNIIDDGAIEKWYTVSNVVFPITGISSFNIVDADPGKILKITECYFVSNDTLGYSYGMEYDMGLYNDPANGTNPSNYNSITMNHFNAIITIPYVNLNYPIKINVTRNDYNTSITGTILLKGIKLDAFIPEP